MFQWKHFLGKPTILLLVTTLKMILKIFYVRFTLKIINISCKHNDSDSGDATVNNQNGMVMVVVVVVVVAAVTMTMALQRQRQWWGQFKRQYCGGGNKQVMTAMVVVIDKADSYARSFSPLLKAPKQEKALKKFQ